VNPFWVVRTGRLALIPVGGADLPELIALKADPMVFAVMLGGVRSAVQTAEELADEVVSWGARGYGTWAVRLLGGGALLGIVALQERPDGRGIGVRFAFRPDLHGKGYAREAAGAALRFGHERAGLRRIVAVARASNFASLAVLGGIGMVVQERFDRHGEAMLMFLSEGGGGLARH
jgi:RimJ/RimL family protein N-acetyltransferase